MPRPGVGSIIIDNQRIIYIAKYAIQDNICDYCDLVTR